MPGQHLACGPFQIDGATQVVRREGEVLPLGHRAVLLLEALFSRPGDVLTKTELMDAGWPNLAVEESNLSVQIAGLRKALGPAPGGSEWIVTVPRIGYRFIASSAPPAVPAEPDRPSIAVLPFENLSSDPEQAYLADGLAEDIILGLAKLSGMRVMARNASFAYRGPGTDVRKVSAGLEVGYVLAGAVRRSGDRLRLSVELAEGATGAQLWAERYDRQMVDVFALQDEITGRVVDALKIKLTPAEAARPTTGGTNDPEALDLFLLGRSMHRGTTQNAEVFHRVIDLLNRALQRDPNYADVYGVLALTYIHNHVNKWTADTDRALAMAREMAERRVSLDPDSAAAHETLSMVADFAQDTETFEREAEIAMSLDPNFHDAPLLRGKLAIRRGEPLSAVPHYEEGMRRNPSLPTTIFFLQMLGMAYLLGGRYETAAAMFRERIVLMPETDWSRAYLVSALGHLGKIEEARKIHAELMAINTGYRLDERLARSPVHLAEQRARVREGWQKAGLNPGGAS